MSDETSRADRPRSAPARALRMLVGIVVVAVVIVVLFTTVFPWVEERTQVPTIGAAPASLSTAVTSG